MALNTGINSLDAGAPDIKYTGTEGPQDPRMASATNPEAELHQIYQNALQSGQIPKGTTFEMFKELLQQSRGSQQGQGVMAAGPTYTQRRRNQMAYGGIAGLDGRKKYGIGSWFQEKIKDPIAKLIPNELKNPLGAAALGTAANYLPVMLPGGSDKTLIQQILGTDTNALDYMKSVMGGDTQGIDQVELQKDINRVTGGGIAGGMPGMLGDVGGSMDYMLPDLPPQLGGSSTLQDAVNMAKGLPTGTSLGTKLKNVVVDKSKQFLGLDGDDTTPGTGTGQDVSWKIPLAVGAGAHEYQKRYLADQPPFPGDETSIDFQTAKQAMADPNLRFKPQEQYVLPSALAAEGGRIGYAGGGNGAGVHDPLEQLVYLMGKRAQGTITSQESDTLDRLIDETDFMEQKAQGGRIGYRGGSPHSYDTGGWELVKPKTPSKDKLRRLLERLKEGVPSFKDIKRNIPSELLEGPGMQEGGLMNLGGMEKDYRQEGGFVPLGGEEKADDVPARLSKNEFVFTADAVRAAGGGDVDAGAEVMENMMQNLEAGGEISEDSQGLEGARGMFANAQQLQKRII
jgi:hypothetical protein